MILAVAFANYLPQIVLFLPNAMFLVDFSAMKHKKRIPPCWSLTWGDIVRAKGFVAFKPFAPLFFNKFSIGVFETSRQVAPPENRVLVVNNDSGN